jgi:hypothetical protein
VRTKSQSPGVSDFASQLQSALEQRGKKQLKEGSPEAKALEILGESLRAALLRDDEPKKVDGRTSAMRQWVAQAKLGERAIFIGYSRMAFRFAADAVGKKISTRMGSFAFGKPEDLQLLNKCTMVTVIEDEAGNRLEGAEPDADDESGDPEAGASQDAEGASP